MFIGYQNSRIAPSSAFVSRGTSRRRVDSNTDLTPATIGFPRRRMPGPRGNDAMLGQRIERGLRLPTICIRRYGNVILIRTVGVHLSGNVGVNPVRICQLNPDAPRCHCGRLSVETMVAVPGDRWSVSQGGVGNGRYRGGLTREFAVRALSAGQAARPRRN